MGNNSDAYLIPFGIDATPYFKGLKEMAAGSDKMTETALEGTKEMSKGFKQAADAGEKLIKVVDADTKGLTKLKETARQVGKEVGEALSGKNVGADFEARMKRFTDIITKFSSATGKGLKFDIDTAKLEHFEQLLASGVNELEILQGVVGATKEALAGMDPNSEEFAQLSEQVELADGFLKEMADTAGQVEGSSKSLKTQLRSMKEELAAMELAGQGNTEEFIKLSVAAGELEDQIGDVSSRVRVLASDTKYIDAGVGAVTALAGGFAAAQGAAALFGSENEAVQKVIEKVTGAMALLQGVQAVAQALNKDSAISVLLFSRAQQSATIATEARTVAEGEAAVATVATTTATRGLTAALLANPITAVLVAIAAVVVALMAFSSSSDDAKKATDDFNKSLEENSNLLNLDEAALKRRTDVQVAQAKMAGKAESEIMKIEGNSLIERLQLRENFLKELQRQYNDENNRQKLQPAELKKLGEDIIKAEEQVADARTEIIVKRGDVAKKVSDEQTAAAAKDKAEAAKRLELQRKNAATEKSILEQQVKFAKELRDAMADSLKDGYEKERQQARAQLQDRVEALNAEKGLSAKAIKDRADIVMQLNKNLVTQLHDIDLKELAERSNLEFQAQQTISDLQKEGLSKEIDQLKLGFEDRRRNIKEQYKNEIALRDILIEQVNMAERIAEEKARNEGRLKAIKDNEENQVLQVETAAKYLSSFPLVEEQKNIAVLQVRKKYAEKTLKALRDQGEEENSTAVLNAKKQAQEIDRTLEAAQRDLKVKGGAINFRDLIFGKHSDAESQAIDKAIQTSMDSVRQVTDFVVDQYQRQIDKKQELIDADNKAVSELESQLDKEKNLRDEGLANNVDGIQKELDEKKAAREQDIKDQQALQEKQNQARRAQLIIDSISQASNLITAATEIFAALAGIPFVGVPLAITTIGLMTGAFITAKIKAFQAVGDGQKFAAGGYIDGEPHSKGGKKYRALDGRGVLELEGGEFVTRKSATQKYGDLLEAINNDDLSGMNDAALKGLLSGLGIHFGTEKTKEAVNLGRERDNLRAVVVLPGDDKNELKNIERHTAFLAEREKNKVERWQDSEFEYIKQGNKVTKVKK